MCLGIPMRVVRVSGLQAHCEDHRGEAGVLDLLLVGPQLPGSWLIGFKGAARAVIDAVEAERIGRALEALQALMAGEAADIDAAFPDLAGRTPQLPEFLRGELDR